MAEHSPEARPRIRRLVGVYNANGTLRGELAYWIGARLGRAHCGLCDITHGTVRERRDWQACRAGLPVPFDAYHLNDQPDEVRALTGGRRAPVVLADTDRGMYPVLGPDEVDECDGSPAQLLAAIDHAVEVRRLVWPN